MCKNLDLIGSKGKQKGKIKIQDMLQKRWEECISDGLD